MWEGKKVCESNERVERDEQRYNSRHGNNLGYLRSLRSMSRFRMSRNAHINPGKALRSPIRACF